MKYEVIFTTEVECSVETDADTPEDAIRSVVNGEDAVDWNTLNKGDLMETSFDNFVVSSLY